jgi:hypothetical protein
MKILNFKLKIGAKRGMSLLIAIGIMSILLFVAFAIVNITLKSTLFASSGRDSQFAFYAAEAGMECALYWDTRFDPSYFDVTTPTGPISCGGDANIATNDTIVGTSTLTRIGGNLVSVFGFVLNTGNNPVTHCAIVTVTKNVNGTTYIKSRGYNTCDTSNPRRVERGIEVTY